MTQEYINNSGIYTDLDNTLRGIPLSQIEEDRDFHPIRSSPPKEIVQFKIEPIGEPQNRRIRYFAVNEQTQEKFYVASVQPYLQMNGLARIGGSIYDRFEEESHFGLWSHFIWPTVMAEGYGRKLVVNTYDRARFTWGFYQLAAHTAEDNLILLMRELLKLDTAKFYYPDLTLNERGHVTQITPNGNKDLELSVKINGENQIPDFMKYMNPTSSRVENVEVLNAAKFIDWANRDPSMLYTTTNISIQIMKNNLRKWNRIYNLINQRVETAIMVIDIHHQGRGKKKDVQFALDMPTYSQKMEALYKIGYNNHTDRINTLKDKIQILEAENRFNNIKIGKGELEL